VTFSQMLSVPTVVPRWRNRQANFKHDNKPWASTAMSDGNVLTSCSVFAVSG
jgi:hypothetical protein